MPSVGDAIFVELGIDSSGLIKGSDQVEREVESVKQKLKAQGDQLEQVAKSVGYGLENLVKNVAGLFGLVLGFEGFKKMVTDAATAGSAMGRFAESLGTTVEVTQKYQQAFRAVAGEDTQILGTLSVMTQDLTRLGQGFQRTEWMNRLEQLIGHPITREKPEDILRESGEAIQRRGLTPAQAQTYFQGLPLTQSDVLAITKPEELQKQLEKQKTQIGTPTTPQAQAMERLQGDISNIKTASELLLLTEVALLEPFLHELLTMTTRILSWLRSVATATGMPATSVTPTAPQTYETPGGAVMVGPRTGIRARPEGTPATPSAPASPMNYTPVPSAPNYTSRPSPQQPTPTPSRQSAVGLHRSGAPADAVDDALRLEGLHERRDRDTIREYLRTGGAGMDPATTAWCAAFVNSSLQREGIQGSGSAVATSFLRWGTPVDKGDVHKGDVLVQSRGHRAGETGGHVGMATGRTRQGPAGLELEMIAGNTKDSVLRYWISANQVTPRRALPNVQTGAAPAAASADANRPRVENNESTTSIQQIHVNTNATNAAGMAKDIKDEIGKHLGSMVDDQ